MRCASTLCFRVEVVQYAFVFRGRCSSFFPGGRSGRDRVSKPQALKPYLSLGPYSRASQDEWNLTYRGLGFRV